jgi:hypothetical protein
MHRWGRYVRLPNVSNLLKAFDALRTGVLSQGSDKIERLRHPKSAVCPSNKKYSRRDSY